MQPTGVHQAVSGAGVPHTQERSPENASCTSGLDLGIGLLHQHLNQEAPLLYMENTWLCGLMALLRAELSPMLWG